MIQLTLSFESGRVEAGVGLDGKWWFSFFTDTEGSYMSADVSEATLRSLLAFADEMRAIRKTEGREAGK